VSLLDNLFKIVAAGPAFFVSAWPLMIFAGVAGTEVGSGRSATSRRWS